jgi:HEPN domain-containing protein
MSAKTLILNAQDSIELAKKNIGDDKQHDFVGYNLAHAAELFMKAVCEMRGISYPHDEQGQDLDYLMELLEESGFSAISSHADVNELTIYNSTRAGHTVRENDRMDLEQALSDVEELKKLVGQALKDH